jgi:hypothetical protein
MSNPLKFITDVLTGGGGKVGNLIRDVGTNYIVGRAIGGKEGGKTAALAGLLGQGLGGAFSAFSGDTPKAEQMSALQKSNLAEKAGGSAAKKVTENVAEKIADSAKSSGRGIESVFKQGEGTLGYAKMLRELGLLKDDNPLLGPLNTKAGEAIATMLVSGLGSKLFDSDEEVGSGRASRPFGGSEKTFTFGGQNIARMAQGGMIDGEYFPRRNGGIETNEGSGTKDDVPAMLMAGEFVMTKDAMKGLGNGDADLGIQRAYSMMDKLERKANG